RRSLLRSDSFIRNSSIHLEELDRSSIVLDERHEDSGAGAVGLDYHILAANCLEEVRYLEGHMRHLLHQIRERSVGLEPDPFHSIRTLAIATHVDLQMLDVLLVLQPSVRRDANVVIFIGVSL